MLICVKVDFLSPRYRFNSYHLVTMIRKSAFLHGLKNRRIFAPSKTE